MVALTIDRELALYEILEVPYSNSTNYIVMDGLTTETHDVAGSIRAAKTVITDFLTTNIYTNAGLQTNLESLLDSWIALGTDSSSLDGASVGNIQGFTDSADRERDLIAQKVKIRVPFFRHHEEIRRKKATIIPFNT